VWLLTIQDGGDFNELDGLPPDMVYISGPHSDQTAAYLAVVSAARHGDIPGARIEQAVLRVLQVKQRLGLIR
jgi:beta-glucosidase-like glycosyl hydrolase